MKLDARRFIPAHRIIVDTATMMDASSRAYVEVSLWPILRAGKRRLVIPKRVWEELVRYWHTGDAERAVLANEALRLIDRMCRDESAGIFGDHDDPPANAAILSVVGRKRSAVDILAIVQDRRLAEGLVRLRDATTAEQDLTVARITAGALESWQFARGERTGAMGGRTRMPRPFPPATGKVSGSAQPVRVSMIPATGDVVFTESGKSIELGRELAKGGEGTVHPAGPGKVAKIYLEGRLSGLTLKKLGLMTQQPVGIDGVCWPQTLLHNAAGEPVGYMMSQATGFPLDTSVFKKPLLQKKFPGWRRIDLVQVAVRVAEIVGQLHTLHVVLGDINPNNILVTPEGQVTFVDLDSVQISDFPCPVGMVNFTRPQHHGKEYATYLRDQDDDRFALAVMLFMILVPGKPPYSHAGGGEPGENIQTKHFPYPLKGKSSSGVPDGPWRLIWNHLSFKVKEAFYEAFKKDVLRTPEEWVSILRSYAGAIEKGLMDPEQGNDIFPTRVKRLSPEVKERFDIWQDEMIALTCRICSKQFEVAKRRLAAMASFPQECPDCRKAARLRREVEGGAGQADTPDQRPASSGPCQSRYAPNTVAVSPLLDPQYASILARIRKILNSSDT